MRRCYRPRSSKHEETVDILSCSTEYSQRQDEKLYFLSLFPNNLSSSRNSISMIARKNFEKMSWKGKTQNIEFTHLSEIIKFWPVFGRFKILHFKEAWSLNFRQF